MENENLSSTEINNETLETPLNQDVEKPVEKKRNKVAEFLRIIFHKTRRSVKRVDIKERINDGREKLKNHNFRKYKKYFYPLLAVLVIVLIFYVVKIPGQGKSNNIDTRPLPAVTLAKTELNKDFKFALKDDNGKKVGELEYKVVSAELQDSIIVKGQRATAVKGRIFLILNIKIVNNNSQGVQVNTRDYIRLSINNKDEWIAADIHNDPVEVQAISTKITRLGFPINEADKDLKLQIGEIEGNKETVNIKFK